MLLKRFFFFFRNSIVNYNYIGLLCHYIQYSWPRPKEIRCTCLKLCCSAPINVFSQRRAAWIRRPKRHLPREFDRPLWHRGGTLNILAGNYRRNFKARTETTDDFLHTFLTHG